MESKTKTYVIKIEMDKTFSYLISYARNGQKLTTDHIAEAKKISFSSAKRTVTRIRGYGEYLIKIEC